MTMTSKQAGDGGRGLGVTGGCGYRRAIMSAMPKKGSKHEPLSPEAIQMVASRFRILGEPIRIRILQVLQEGERTVSEVVAAVGSTQPNVSKHLRILQESGFVGRRQNGNNVFCYISDPTVLDLCDTVCSSIHDQLTDHARLAAELQHGVRRK